MGKLPRRNPGCQLRGTCFDEAGAAGLYADRLAEQ